MVRLLPDANRADLMEELGIDLSFNRKVIEWADVCIPMKDRGTVSDRATTQNLYNLATSAPVLRMSEDRHNEIIKLMYSKADIDQHVKTLTRSISYSSQTVRWHVRRTNKR